MKAKITSKLEMVLQEAPDGESVVLRPSQNRADATRAKLAELGVSKRDVADAVKWARICV